MIEDLFLEIRKNVVMNQFEVYRNKILTIKSIFELFIKIRSYFCILISLKL